MIDLKSDHICKFEEKSLFNDFGIANLSIDWISIGLLEENALLHHVSHQIKHKQTNDQTKTKQSKQENNRQKRQESVKKIIKIMQCSS